jgi:hypothetical protein
MLAADLQLSQKPQGTLATASQPSHQNCWGSGRDHTASGTAKASPLTPAASPLFRGSEQAGHLSASGLSAPES